MYSGFIPSREKGIEAFFEHSGIELVGKHVVMISLGDQDVALEDMLQRANATVTVCNKHTVDIQEYTQEADIVISTDGEEGIIKGDWLKPDAIVMNAGITDDVDYESCEGKASLIIPASSMGAMYTIGLMQNTVLAWKTKVLKDMEN